MDDLQWTIQKSNFHDLGVPPFQETNGNHHIDQWPSTPRVARVARVAAAPGWPRRCGPVLGNILGNKNRDLKQLITMKYLKPSHVLCKFDQVQWKCDLN
jgi:hypothetical protein